MQHSDDESGEIANRYLSIRRDHGPDSQELKDFLGEMKNDPMSENDMLHFYDPGSCDKCGRS